jgi:cobalt-zinc-cadmium efflux system membrane fusion protein
MCCTTTPFSSNKRICQIKRIRIMKLKAILCIITACILMASCGKNKNNENNSAVQEDLIKITHQQFESSKMAFGEPIKMPFPEIVKCNGNIVSKPSGIAKISTSVSGIVQKIHCTTGQRVYAGQIIFELSGNDLIELQKDFAETASQLKRMKSEYERIKSLFSEKVGTEKELISAESEFKVANAKYSALKMKIQLIGLDASKIEDGNFYESFSIKSPLNGYISQINVSLGQYADQQTIIAEVFDVTQFLLRISVFEKDISNLKEGQKITFRLLGDNTLAYSATLISIGKNVNDESRTITCFAEIDELKGAILVNNAYVEAGIITSQDSVTAISEESLIKSQGINYILTLLKDEDNSYFLKKIKVNTGRLNNGYVEILDNPELQKILIKGAYNIKIE